MPAVLLCSALSRSRRCEGGRVPLGAWRNPREPRSPLWRTEPRARTSGIAPSAARYTRSCATISRPSTPRSMKGRSRSSCRSTRERSLKRILIALSCVEASRAFDVARVARVAWWHSPAEGEDFVHPAWAGECARRRRISSSTCCRLRWPLRQWVLTFPFSWRRRLAQDGAFLGALGRIFVDTSTGPPTAVL
jgi:hypothetical protein